MVECALTVLYECALCVHVKSNVSMLCMLVWCLQFILTVAGVPQAWLWDALGYHSASLFMYHEAAQYFAAAENMTAVSGTGCSTSVVNGMPLCSAPLVCFCVQGFYFGSPWLVFVSALFVLFCSLCMTAAQLPALLFADFQLHTVCTRHLLPSVPRVVRTSPKVSSCCTFGVVHP